MFDSMQPTAGTDLDAPERLVPVDFLVMAAITLVGSVMFTIIVNPAPPVTPAGGPLMIALGTYFVVCSTFFKDFILYRLKIQRAIDWYGEDATHVMYRLMGFGCIGAGLVFLLSMLG